MKKLVAMAIVVAGLLSLPAQARNITVPSNDPALIVVVPNNWKFGDSEYGYSATSPDEDVYFAVESAAAKDVDKLMKANDEWMKDNKMKDVAPQKSEGTLNGINVTTFHFDTTDANGPTQVEFVLMPAGKGRMAMLTLWGSKAERAKHSAEIDAIMNSVKPLN